MTARACVALMPNSEPVVELLTAFGVAVELSERQRGAVAIELARRFRDEVDHAVQGVGAPHRRRGTADHFDLPELVGIHRQQVPRHEAEEIEIQAAAVEQRQRRGGERRRRAAHGDVVIAGGGLREVHARDRTEQLGVVGRGRRRNHVGGHHRHGGRRVDELLLDLRRRHDHLLFVDRWFGRRRGRLRRRLLRAGLCKCKARCRQREHQHHWQGTKFHGASNDGSTILFRHNVGDLVVSLL